MERIRIRTFFIVCFLVLAGILFHLKSAAEAVEIPLDTVTPVRIGFIDLQKVFDTFPEKSFAEGDLLKEIQKRKSEIVRRQTEITTLRQQIASDQAALDQAKAGRTVVVPRDDVAALEPPQPKETSTPEPAPKVTTSSTTVEPYPTDEPLAGLPGHEVGVTPETKLPGMQKETPMERSNLLDNLAASGTPTVLTAEAQTALLKRVENNKRTLDKATYNFKDYRSKALADMKQLQTQKTYGVMSKIYAVLQGLAREENITVVMDKAYVLYGEDTVDLTNELVNRLNTEQTQL